MSKSKKRLRSSIRTAPSQHTVIVTYAYDEDLEEWIAPWGLEGQSVIDFADGETLEELYENATKDIQSYGTFSKNAVIRHVVDTTETPTEKQAEAAVFLVLKNA